jgi:tripeptide aminopeptidase
LVNTNYRLDLDGTASPLVLRIFARDRDACAREERLLQLVAGTVPAPRLIFADPSANHFRLPWMVTTWIDGLPLPAALAALTLEDTPSLAASLGAAAAAIGAFTFPASGFFGRDLSIAEPLDAPTEMTRERLRALLFDGAAGSRLGVALSERLWRAIEAHVDELDALAGRVGLVHADFRDSNLLVAREGSAWHVTGALDWEFAFAGPALFDLGSLLRREETVLPPGFAARVVTAYRAAGGFAPPGWRRMTLLMDLMNLCGFAEMPDSRGEMLTDVTSLIERTVARLEAGAPDPEAPTRPLVAVVRSPTMSVKYGVTNAVTLARVTRTMTELAGVPSVSGQEDQARAYVLERLEQLGLEPMTDAAGNLIARVTAEPPERDAEPPVLLNAHLDRVPPGLAHIPVIEDGVMRSDGETNLGADDSAGITIILEALAALKERVLPHPPLLLVFTTAEEVGLTGAKAFDPEPWGPADGLIFDNAGEAGVAVTRAATYIAFDVIIHGSGGHPGKNLAGAVSAIEIFRRASYPWGALDGDTTRVSVGRVEAGTARNAIPRELRAQGEIRTLLEGAEREELLASVAHAFTDAAQAMGGAAEVSFDSHCDSYQVASDEPALLAWSAAVSARGGSFRTLTTFIGSDASAIRRYIRAVTISTGAMNEHTTEEYIALEPLAEVVETAIDTLTAWGAAPEA